jgi:hypothetical protein
MLNKGNYLKSKVEDINERGNAKTTIKQLMIREENRNDFSTIKRALKPKRSKGI